MVILNVSDLHIEPIETDNVSAENPFAKTRHGLAALALSTLMATTSPAVAQESNTPQEKVLVADASDSPEGTVARAFEGLPTSVEEMQEASERQRVISDVIRRRENGIEFYGPYLDQFNALSEESQYQIALLINPENSQGGPDYPQDTIELVRGLRIPESMIQAILDEAESNGADPDPDWGDIQAFKKVLIELRELGATQHGDTFAELTKFSPDNVAKIYFVYAVNTANARLADSQGRLLNAQGRLVDVQGRLVDAQGRLLDIQETNDILQDALDAANGN